MKHNHYMIRRETPDDYQEVEYLTREAFWNVYRPGCIEHYIVHQDDVIIGHIMYVNAEILSDNGQKIPIMTFGPISIAPEHQRKGYGKILLDFSMDKARALGVGAICIEGNIAFYGKSGFVTASSKGIHYYAEPRSARVPYFLVKELQEGFLDGVTGTYKPPSGYFINEEEAEKFDAQFPPKEKSKLPGQLF